MRNGPLEGCITTPRLQGWIAVALIAGVLVAHPALALDSTSEPTLAAGTPRPIEVFRDEFYGSGLGPHWRIERPDPAAFAVSDGTLQVESRKPLGTSGARFANLFLLDEPMPAGDWKVTAALKLHFDSGAENFYLTLRDDADRWFGAQIRSVPNKYTGHRLMLAAVEARDGRIEGHERPLLEIECNVCDSEWLWRGFSRKLIRDQIVRLRIEKHGSRYEVSGKLGENPGAEWVRVESIESSVTTRSLAFGLAQSRLPDIRQGAIPGGSSSAAIDWIAIEIPREPTRMTVERPTVAQSAPTR